MLYALDVKTSYSMLSSLIKIDDLTEKAKELGYFSLAITDTICLELMNFIYHA